jgi:hypothetical protein
MKRTDHLASLEPERRLFSLSIALGLTIAMINVTATILSLLAA